MACPKISLWICWILYIIVVVAFGYNMTVRTIAAIRHCGLGDDEDEEHGCKNRCSTTITETQTATTTIPVVSTVGCDSSSNTSFRSRSSGSGTISTSPIIDSSMGDGESSRLLISPTPTLGSSTSCGSADVATVWSTTTQSAVWITKSVTLPAVTQTATVTTTTISTVTSKVSLHKKLASEFMKT